MHHIEQNISEKNKVRPFFPPKISIYIYKKINKHLYQKNKLSRRNNSHLKA